MEHKKELIIQLKLTEKELKELLDVVETAEHYTVDDKSNMAKKWKEKLAVVLYD